jgi:uncharacterized protein (TIGR02266 family)
VNLVSRKTAALRAELEVRLSQEQVQTHMLEQVGRARAALGEALGQLQDIRQPGLDVDTVSEALAAAVKSLFDAESGWTIDGKQVDLATGHLRRTLALMQDVRSDDPALQAATATIARTLAILFPVVRSLEPAEQDPGPIPLTEKLPPRAEERPLPLITRRAEPAIPPPEGERRGDERRAVEVELGFQSDTNFYTGLTMDISSGGLFVATYDIPPVGTAVNVNFSLPGGPIMSLNGVVRWVREINPVLPDMTPGIGVSFDDLDPADEAALNQYLARTSPLLYEDINE